MSIAPRPGFEQRFWSRVDKDGPVPLVKSPTGEPLGQCWYWRGAKSKLGYGTARLPGSAFIGAHRLSYELVIGPIPEGMHLDHLCRYPSCVRPSHLEPVTQRTNVRRGRAPAAINARRTHCAKGHALPVEPVEHYGRRCQSCKTTRVRSLKNYREQAKNRQSVLSAGDLEAIADRASDLSSLRADDWDRWVAELSLSQLDVHLLLDEVRRLREMSARVRAECDSPVNSGRTRRIVRLIEQWEASNR